MTTKNVSKELIMDEYNTAKTAGLNDEQAFHYCLFMLEFKPSMFSMRDYYADDIISRFKKGSMIAYADWQCRQMLEYTYKTVIECGGLIDNYFYKLEKQQKEDFDSDEALQARLEEF